MSMLKAGLAGILLLSLTLPVPVNGGEKPRNRGPKDLPFIARCLEHRDELFLSSEQIRELEKLQEQYRAGALEKESALKKTRFDYLNLMKSDTPDFALLRAKTKEIADLQLEQKNIALDAYEAGYLTLSDDQKARLAGLKSRKKSRKSRVGNAD